MITEILRAMDIPDTASEVQRIQTAHRVKLISFWEIPKGARVLEIGCGQGDTLAALAYMTGEKGFVHGIDIAGEEYGSPETLGQARQRLLHSTLGSHIRMDFNVDIRKDDIRFEQPFDYIVMSHCLWYFSSYEELCAILERVRLFGRKLCLAEWNPGIERADQLAHFKAAAVQAVCESFKPRSGSNIRTMFYPRELERAVTRSGWQIEKRGMVDSPDLQDGNWEAAAAAEWYPHEIERLTGVPDRLKQLLLAQIEDLKEASVIKPMSVFCLTANVGCT